MKRKKIDFLRYKRAKSYKSLFIILFLIILLFCPTTSFSATYATNQQDYTISSEEIESEVDEQLEGLDLKSIDEILSQFNSKELAIFGGNSFLGKLKKLISGDFDNGKSIWVNLITLFLDDLVGLIPIISLIIAISLIGNMLQALRPSSNGKSISNLINFVTYGVIVVLVLSIVTKMITNTTNTILSIKS